MWRAFGRVLATTVLSENVSGQGLLTPILDGLNAVTTSVQNLIKVGNTPYDKHQVDSL